MKAFLYLSAILLAACAPYQKAGTDKTGQPYVAQYGGWWSDTDGIVQKAKNGNILLEQVVEHQNGTKGPQGVVDGVVSAAATHGLFSQNKSADNNSAKIQGQQIGAKKAVDLKKLDNEALGITGANDVNKINASKQP